MVCVLCGAVTEGEEELCRSCATLSGSFTETLGADSRAGRGALTPPDAPTSPMLDGVVPLPPSRPAALAFVPGESFGPRYTIVEEIGGGGMGQVYKAIDRQLGRAVALKLVRPELAARVDALQRFQRELGLAQQVTHQNVCRVHDLGEVGGIRYISMEYIEGQTLEDLVRSVGHLSPRQTVTLGRQICLGLAAIHERSIIHRDLKPGNIMVDRAGHALVMDFGMAYRPGSEKLTAAGSVLGTLAYLSPEHARGHSTDVRSDIYALGLIFFEMLTGRRPPGDDGQVPLALRDASEPCPPPSRLVPEVPAVLDAVVLRCLRRDPAARYDSAQELEKALAEAGTGMHSTMSFAALPAGATPTPSPVAFVGSPRARALTWAGGLVMALIVALVLVKLWPRPPLAATTLALLPFTYEGPEANRYLHELLPLVIGDSLRAVPGIQVVSFTTARAFGPQEDAKTVARALGVDHVVQGTVKVEGGRVLSRLLLRSREGGGDEPPIEDASPVGTADAAERLAANLARALGRDAPSQNKRSPQAMELYFQGQQSLEGWDIQRSSKKAETAFRGALEVDPKFVEARAGLALALCNLFQETGEPAVIEKAGLEARQAVEQSPSLPEAHLALGVVQILRGRSAEAAVSLQKAQNLAPADDAVCRRIARAYARQGRFAEAEQHYERAILLRPNFWENYNVMAGFMVNRGNLERAKELFGKVITLRPKSDVGFINLAHVYMWDGEFDQAEPLLQEALKLEQSYQAHNDLGALYYATSRYEDAVRSFQAAIDVGGPQAEPWGGLGDAYRQLGQKEKALEAYDRAIGLARVRLGVDAENADLRAGLAMFLAGSGNCTEARLEAARATRDAQPSVNAHFYSAVAYAICADRQPAIRHSLKALEGGAVSDLRSNPDLRAVRDDPAIKARLRKAGGA